MGHADRARRAESERSRAKERGAKHEAAEAITSAAHLLRTRAQKHSRLTRRMPEPST
jgi:hypothetical protein